MQEAAGEVDGSWAQSNGRRKPENERSRRGARTVAEQGGNGATMRNQRTREGGGEEKRCAAI